MARLHGHLQRIQHQHSAGNNTIAGIDQHLAILYEDLHWIVLITSRYPHNNGCLPDPCTYVNYMALSIGNILTTFSGVLVIHLDEKVSFWIFGTSSNQTFTHLSTFF